MGCSASISKSGFFNRHKFDCNVFHETTTTLKFTDSPETTTTNTVQNLPNSEENNNKVVKEVKEANPINTTKNTDTVSELKSDGLQVNQAHILIISRESSITSSCGSDYLRYNNVRKRSASLPASRTWASKRHSITGTEIGQENRVIKSVLKTGLPPVDGHILANRPIKSVTFLDAVTVVTVY